MKEETREPGVPRYHYSREERTASLPETMREKPQGKGIFRGNRSLAITLIDVVFLLMLIAVLSVVNRLMGDNTILPGYTISAEASVSGDRVLVIIKVKARDDSETAEQVRIRIGYPEGRDRIELNDFLPTEDNSEQIYRGSLRHDQTQTQVRIAFFAGTSAGTMTAKIK